MNYLKELRLKKKLTQKELAEKLGVSRLSVLYWENNLYNISIDNLIKYSNYFGVSIDDLVKIKKEAAKNEQVKKSDF